MPTWSDDELKAKLAENKELSIETRGNPLPRLVPAITDMRVVELTIDHLPLPELSPNSRVHWAVKARAVSAQRQEAGWLAKQEWGEQKPIIYARISYTFCVKDKRHRDIDNLVASAKSLQDGLVDGGVLTNDDSEHLELGRCRIVRGSSNQTIIRIEELAG